MTSEKNAITIENLHKSFGNLKVLDGISMNIKSGTVVALLGPNGSGKTTIVRILSTLLKADKGTVLIDGLDVVKNAKNVRSLIGLTGQYTAIDEYLTGRENLKMIGRLYHLSKNDTNLRTEELLKQFNLMDAANRYVKTYSGGMRRRLDLAASLIATPPIIFLDEPTTALDPVSRLEMWNIIENLVGLGTTILLTTQHLDEADRLADHIVVIDKGKIIARGSSDELKMKAGNERVQFVFNTTDSLHKAATLIGSEDDLTIDKKQRSLSVNSRGGVHRLKEMLEIFEKADIDVAGLSCSKPTLDDVFIKLTGHKTSPGQQDGAL